VALRNYSLTHLSDACAETSGVWGTINYKSSAVAEMSDRLATLDIGRKVGRAAAVPLSVRGWIPHLTQCRLGRGQPSHQVASWYIQPFGHSTPTLQDRQTHSQNKNRYSTEEGGQPTLQKSLHILPLSATFCCVRMPIVLATCVMYIVKGFFVAGGRPSWYNGSRCAVSSLESLPR